MEGGRRDGHGGRQQGGQPVGMVGGRVAPPRVCVCAHGGRGGGGLARCKIWMPEITDVGHVMATTPYTLHPKSNSATLMSHDVPPPDESYAPTRCLCLCRLG